jgi:lipopolysaccharide/colanic/teichoic acid biosynthesis glycosyltransferase
MTRWKRIFDLSAAIAGLLVLWPVFVATGLLIKLGDGGPVFFRQRRIGRNGAPFWIWKFRTMAMDANGLGGSLAVGQDPRITPAGRLLRRSKLDELPQLINVIRGEMSFVGPRPEIPRFVDRYGPEERKVLDLTPGITDVASIAYRNESDLLSKAPDPEKFYIEQIIKEKIRLNLEYARDANVFSDIGIIVKTLMHLAK